MELVSLEMERFGCVTRAHIAFKPGLNVLHGANEIGKSSIARAIRFALLLPSSSSAVEPWIPWSGGGDPTVTLVFRSGSTEYYRVKKVFGTNTASLERSSDGAGWANLARAREVEARLRALLQWGIPEPGGAKAPKGLPESFLASALLADQDEVASIFQQDLDSDGVDSGRVRVRAALQAMAQDPLFKTVLDAAQGRVDEAFTPGGQRKRGRDLGLFPCAAVDLPPFPSSAMDGFAVRSEDTPGRLPVVGRIAAGVPAPRALEPGEAMAIATGGVVPDGADAVVPIELVRADERTVEVPEPVSSGANVRSRGGDTEAGDPVVAVVREGGEGGLDVLPVLGRHVGLYDVDCASLGGAGHGLSS